VRSIPASNACHVGLHVILLPTTTMGCSLLPPLGPIAVLGGYVLALVCRLQRLPLNTISMQKWVHLKIQCVQASNYVSRLVSLGDDICTVNEYTFVAH
jgi:hypothetical protein